MVRQLGKKYMHMCSARFWQLLTWINFNHMPRKVRNEIIYPFPNLHGKIVSFWEWIISSICYDDCDYLSSLELKLIHFNKRGPMFPESCVHTFLRQVFFRSCEWHIQWHWYLTRYTTAQLCVKYAEQITNVYVIVKAPKMAKLGGFAHLFQPIECDRIKTDDTTEHNWF